MFRETFQSGFLSVLYSIGSKPFQIWNNSIKNGGKVSIVTDEDIKSNVIEIQGLNSSNCYIKTPIDPKMTLAIKLPVLHLLVKNMDKYFGIEFTLLDVKNNLRRFRLSNFQKKVVQTSSVCTMPLVLNKGWNHIQFDLRQFTNKSYGTEYKEALTLQINSNCRIRRVYFSDKIYTDEEVPDEFRIFLPQQKKADW